MDGLGGNWWWIIMWQNVAQKIFFVSLDSAMHGVIWTSMFLEFLDQF